MCDEQLISQGNVDTKRVNNLRIAGTLYIIVAICCAILGTVLLDNISSNSSQFRAVYIVFLLAVCLFVEAIGNFLLASRIKETKIMVYKKGIQGVAIKINPLLNLICELNPFEIEFSDIISLPNDKNIAINTKNGEYFIPVDAKDVFELRKCIDKEIKNSSQK